MTIVSYVAGALMVLLIAVALLTVGWFLVALIAALLAGDDVGDGSEFGGEYE